MARPLASPAVAQTVPHAGLRAPPSLLCMGLFRGRISGSSSSRMWHVGAKRVFVVGASTGSGSVPSVSTVYPPHISVWTRVQCGTQDKGSDPCWASLSSPVTDRRERTLQVSKKGASRKQATNYYDQMNWRSETLPKNQC